MRPMSLFAAGIGSGLVAALMLLTAIPAFAENGRDFAGYLSVTDVVGGGVEEVLDTLELEVFNYSGAAVTNAALRMESLLRGAPLYESPPTVDMAYRDRAVVTESVLAVPREDYDLWVQGALPLVTVIYTDSNGTPRATPVELVPMLIEGEAQR